MFNFRKIVVGDRDLMLLQSNTDAVFQQLRNCPLLDGVLVEAVTLTTSNTTVDHTLGRQPLGFIVTDLNKDATIFRAAWNAKTITLQSSATATIASFWIF